MLRNTIAVIAGTIAGTLVMIILESVSQTFYPALSTCSMNDPELRSMYFASLPVGAWGLFLVSRVVGAFSGGIVTSLISGREKSGMPTIVGFLMLLLGIMNLFMKPQPEWFFITSMAAYIPLAYLGYLAVRKKR